jgi:hypothetical protein
MASIMLVVAFSAAFAPSTNTDGATGDISNPQYIIGTESVAYVLTGTDVTGKIDLNAKAFDGPSFTCKVYKADSAAGMTTTANGITTPTGNPVFSNDPDSTVTSTGITVNIDNETGVGTIKFTSAAGTGYFLIEVILEDTVTGYGTVYQNYYYAANISTTATTMDVVLGTYTGTNNAFVELTSNLEFQKDTDYPGAFAKVRINTGTTEDPNYEYLGIEDYDFYESNLPDGIDMKSNGEIAGKIISSAAISANNDFKVFAINKNTGKTVLSGSFKYDVADSANTDYFRYQIESENSKFYSEVGYAAIKNSDTLTVTILNVEDGAITGDAATAFSAAYSYNGGTNRGLTPLTPSTTENGTTVTLPVLTDDSTGDYTGIVQLQITKTVGGSTYTATIHVMLVGPLVHSGLDPTVTSA